MITLQSDITGKGVGIYTNAGKYNGNVDYPAQVNLNLTIDLNGHTFTVNEAVGSPKTESQAFHIEKGSAGTQAVTNNVTIKNGSIVASTKDVKLIIQNYSNLTIDSVNLSGTEAVQAR